MSENNKTPPTIMPNEAYPMLVDGPVYLSVDGATQELTVKAFAPALGRADPIAVHIHFTNEAFGQLAGGIVQLIEQGHITLGPSTRNPVQ